MKRKAVLVGALALLLAGATLIGAASTRASEPMLASSNGALALIDKALAGPAGPDDEGQYNMIDPIGPGGATPLSADNEVFSKTMIGGVYTRWQPYHDPFTSSGGYNGGLP